MERGFKSRCEQMSKSIRAELGLDSADPLCPDKLADYLEIPIWDVRTLGLNEEDLNQLVKLDPDSWSAITVSAHGREAIVVHPNHRGGRYSSDVMHELAHLLLGHQPNTMFFAGEESLALRGYDKAAEEEANWLAGALLLPREVLVHLRRQRTPLREACESYGVSRRMMDYRSYATGVERQFSRRKSQAR